MSRELDVLDWDLKRIGYSKQAEHFCERKKINEILWNLFFE